MMPPDQQVTVRLRCKHRNKRRDRIVFLRVKTPISVVIVLSLVSSGCVDLDSHDTRETTERRSIALGGARSAQVQVDLGAGELRIEGGSEGLLDGEFTYSGRQRPELQYNVSGGRGFLSVRQPRTHGWHGDHNRWDLRLSDQAVTELRVNVGAGKSELRLGGMSMTRLDLDIGAGEVIVDLTGPWEKDFEGNVHGGVGQATVRLPRTVAVRVKASGGIGGINVQNLTKQGGYYVNGVYDKAPVTLRLEVTGGIGEINLIG